MNIEKALEGVEKILLSEGAGAGGAFERLFRDSSLCRGKRLRSKLFFLFSRDAGEESLKTAAAIELLHAAALIHDDIIDDSGTRRGAAALHVKDGAANSVLYGDYLFSSAFSLAARPSDGGVLAGMAEAVCETVEGEILQNKRKRDINLTEREYFSITGKKSGALFALSCRLGAMAGGADEKTAARFRECGRELGKAYQLADDYLDYFGEERGREKFKDLRGGVVTLPLICLLGKCSPGEREEVKAALEAGGEAARITGLMADYRVPGIIARKMEGLYKKIRAGVPGYVFTGIQENFNFARLLNNQRPEALP